jgi:hypothetical protein
MALRKIIYAGRNGSKSYFRFVVLMFLVIAQLVMHFKTGQTLFSLNFTINFRECLPICQRCVHQL